MRGEKYKGSDDTPLLFPFYSFTFLDTVIQSLFLIIVSSTSQSLLESIESAHSL